MREWPFPSNQRQNSPRQYPVEWEGNLPEWEQIGTNGSLPMAGQIAQSPVGGKERTPRYITYGSVRERRACK